MGTRVKKPTPPCFSPSCQVPMTSMVVVIGVANVWEEAMRSNTSEDSNSGRVVWCQWR